MSFMSDDIIRKRISTHKNDFDKVRRQVRKLQQGHDKLALKGRHTDEDGLELSDLETQNSNKQERVML